MKACSLDVLLRFTRDNDFAIGGHSRDYRRPSICIERMLHFYILTLRALYILPIQTSQQATPMAVWLHANLMDEKAYS